ncbi:MAG: hypothetical protein HN442_04085 [Halieaceae bacterium]|jgi:hypothetical protein|nr:hypothetical protein [Halieaceae bacterium]
MQNGLVLALISLALATQAKGAEPVPHLNSVSAFLGVTSEGRRQRASTLGLEYERRLSEEWFITPAMEHAFGDLDFSVVTLTLGYRFNRWAVYAGPGVEWAQQDHVDGAGTQREFLFRTGVLYELEVGDLIVAPHAMVDFVADEKVAVVGVTVGINF